MLESITPFHERIRFIGQYVAETGFPDSTEKIRSSLREAFKHGQEATNLPLLYAGCDYHCSVGEGGNCAVPGSDVEGLIFITDSKISEEMRVKYTQVAQGSINPKLITRFNWGFESNYFIPIQSLLEKSGSRWDIVTRGKDERLLEYIAPNEASRITAIVCQVVRRIKHGTELFSRQSQLIDTLRHTPLALTSPPYKHGAVSDQFFQEQKIPNKYQVRSQLKLAWPTLELWEQEVIIKVSLQYCHQPVDHPIDLSRNGHDVGMLHQLLEKGLFFIQDNLYLPSWLTPLPMIFKNT